MFFICLCGVSFYRTPPYNRYKQALPDMDPHQESPRIQSAHMAIIALMDVSSSSYLYQRIYLSRFCLYVSWTHGGRRDHRQSRKRRQGRWPDVRDKDAGWTVCKDGRVVEIEEPQCPVHGTCTYLYRCGERMPRTGWRRNMSFRRFRDQLWIFWICETSESSCRMTFKPWVFASALIC